MGRSTQILIAGSILIGALLVSNLPSIILPPKTDFSSVQNSTITLLASTRCLNEPFMTSDPYLTPQTPEAMDRTGFCAVKLVPGTFDYHLQTFKTEKEAESAGWKVTHKHKCGACSTLRDLAVYLQHRDLTAPVRKCATMAWRKAFFFECLDNLGFTEDCAKIWYYNSLNTARECFTTCMLAWVKGEESNKPDGSLNDCLQCDETKSGPNFQRFAGRTRRNSGIYSSIDRDRSEIYHVDHTYFEVRQIAGATSDDAGVKKINE